MGAGGGGQRGCGGWWQCMKGVLGRHHCEMEVDRVPRRGEPAGGGADGGGGPDSATGITRMLTRSDRRCAATRAGQIIVD